MATLVGTLPASRAAGASDGMWLPHLVIAMGVLVTAFPLWVALVAATLTTQAIAQAPMPLIPGGEGPRVFAQVLGQGGAGTITTIPVARMLVNSAVMASAIAIGKIAISLLSAYAVVFFRFPGRMALFWLIFMTLMLPVEVRIMPTLQVVTDLGMMNSYAGLVVPLIASATATLLLKQMFQTIPDELLDAAKIDGCGPLRFFWSILLPLSRTTIAALAVILFIYGWNQYLWPLLITTDRNLDTIVIGLAKMIDTAGGPTEWNKVMATAVLALLPPVAVVVVMRRWFVKGLVETEK
jgi:sn-glycerol 3-phosphate transport system permease protein